MYEGEFNVYYWRHSIFDGFSRSVRFIDAIASARCSTLMESNLLATTAVCWTVTKRAHERLAHDEMGNFFNLLHLEVLFIYFFLCEFFWKYTLTLAMPNRSFNIESVSCIRCGNANRRNHGPYWFHINDNGKVKVRSSHTYNVHIHIKSILVTSIPNRAPLQRKMSPDACLLHCNG